MPPRRQQGQSTTEVVVVAAALLIAFAWWPDGPLRRLVDGLDTHLQRYTLAVSRP